MVNQPGNPKILECSLLSFIRIIRYNAIEQIKVLREVVSADLNFYMLHVSRMNEALKF
jgi:hypothetical protein